MLNSKLFLLKLSIPPTVKCKTPGKVHLELEISIILILNMQASVII